MFMGKSYNKKITIVQGIWNLKSYQTTFNNMCKYEGTSRNIQFPFANDSYNQLSNL